MVVGRGEVPLAGDYTKTTERIVTINSAPTASSAVLEKLHS
jgi:hypothetical protein